MVVALSRVPVVAAFGKRSQEFHDLVDLMSLTDRQPGPITTWENDDVDDFIHGITFWHRGMLDVKDQDRKTIVCYVSECDAIPNEWASAAERMRLRQW